MAKSKLSELNDHLFYQIERLSNSENPDSEVKRSEALSKLSSQVVQVHKTFIDAVKVSSSAIKQDTAMNEFFGIKTLTESKENEK